jgi:carboxypeptidase C (cathepsin A)
MLRPHALRLALLPFLVSALACGPKADAAPPPSDATSARSAADKDGKHDKSPDPILPHHFTPEEVITTGAVTVAGQRIPYHAVAGSLVIHGKGWDDVTQRVDLEPDKKDEKDKDDEGGKSGAKMTVAEASVFFVAYFKDGAPSATRPITFLYNGGPGSATVWLHMGAFGPRRVTTPGDRHQPSAPYALVNNDFSLLDATDLVFIDAPGAGFSRIAGPAKEKAFYGVDGDARAFSDFITTFLGKYGRWNSPKYLFGESYGTTRSAVLIANLEAEKSVDFNGVVLLSQILNFALYPGGADGNPGEDVPYELALPTYAATAWYHHKLGSDVPSDLKTLVAEVEHFAVTEYALALQQGTSLSEADRASIAAKLHKYTSLPLDYLRKAHLPVTAGEFAKALQDGDDVSTGRLDSRFSGPAIDPLGKEPDYDPFEAAVGSAYVSAFNDYVRKDLKFGEGRDFHLFADGANEHWNMEHHSYAGGSWGTALNVMGDLAVAMKLNPDLHIQLNGGYYDLATPFFQGNYEMQHLPIPDALAQNVEFRRYESGHMVYAVEAQLHALHDNVADFIRRTSSGAKRAAPPK